MGSLRSLRRNSSSGDAFKAEQAAAEQEQTDKSEEKHLDCYGDYQLQADGCTCEDCAVISDCIQESYVLLMDDIESVKSEIVAAEARGDSEEAQHLQCNLEDYEDELLTITEELRSRSLRNQVTLAP